MNIKNINRILGVFLMWHTYQLLTLLPVAPADSIWKKFLLVVVIIASLVSQFGLITNTYLKASYAIAYITSNIRAHWFYFVVELSFQYLHWILLYLLAAHIWNERRFETPLRRAYWLVFGGLYTYQGFLKLSSESWLSGVSIKWLLSWGILSDYLSNNLDTFYSLSAHSIALFQFLSIAMIFHPRLRVINFTFLTIMHLGMTLFTEFYQISFIMLIFHLVGWVLIKNKKIHG